MLTRFCLSFFLISLSFGQSSTSILYSFKLTDALSPTGSPTVYQGNIYGSSSFGGPTLNGCIFRLYPTKSGGYTLIDLHDFSQGDGLYPAGNIAVDASGNLFGTTQEGGQNGYGTLWELVRPPKLSAAWSFQVIHSFLDTEGAPLGGVVYHNGAIFGISPGAVFELSTPGDGSQQYQDIVFTPQASTGGLPTFDSSGNLYALSFNAPTQIFKYSPQADGSWTQTLVAPLSVSNTQSTPWNIVGGILSSPSGAVFYGLSSGGGEFFSGTVYKVSQDSSGQWVTTVLSSFNSSSVAYSPSGNLQNTKKKYYGLLSQGGSEVFQAFSSGTSKSWIVNDLLDSSNIAAGSGYTGFTFDSSGNLYGASQYGGSAGFGAVWKITP